MTIGRICSREVLLAEPDETARSAAQRMKLENVGSLVVIDEERKPLGILTDRDLTLRVVAAGKIPDKTYVRDIMSEDPMMVPEATPIEMALEKMKSHAYRRILVVDGQGRLEGILSVDDVIDLLAEEITTIGGLLNRQSVRYRPGE